MFAFAALGSSARAQEEPSQGPPPPDQPANAPAEPAEPPPPAADVARVVVHGIVKNAVTGEPLARALVRIEGDAVTGRLTDGEGRFEIPGVPVGPQAFQVIKPGFNDQASAGTGGPPAIINGSSNSEHNVYVVSDMPDLAFSLTPTNAIRGQIELSSGDPAQGISVMLLHRGVQDGRAVWQPVTNARTNSEGAYRFAGLTDGTYAVFTEPTMDSDIAATFVEPGSDRAVTRSGYPSVFYPDARDLAGAAKIQVSGGQQAQANLLLTQEPFQLVRADLTLPGATKAAGGPQMNVNVNVLDVQGHQIPYGVQYDPVTHSVQAFLPDGTYAIQAIALGIPKPLQTSGRRIAYEDSGPQGPLIGQTEFSVAGQALTHLRIPLAAQRTNVVQVSLFRSNSQQPATANPQPPPIVIMVSQAGGLINDGMVTSYAEGYATGPIEATSSINPGSYWVHTTIPQKTLCEASFTAGGASLAREPLVLGFTGTTAPLTLTLRDDCASLKISLPPEADIPSAGDEPYYTIYVIPDFDSTSDITPVVLRPTSGGTFTMSGLTPGSYHVYTFASPVQLEYRNPEALAASSNSGQAVTLAPGSSIDLVVEVPKH